MWLTLKLMSHARLATCQSKSVFGIFLNQGSEYRRCVQIVKRPLRHFVVLSYINKLDLKMAQEI